MDTEFLLECLKWGGLVLLAGFIGQFGKSLAQKAMRRGKKKDAAAGETEEGGMTEQERAAYQLEKKRLKAIKKAVKKGKVPPEEAD